LMKRAFAHILSQSVAIATIGGSCASIATRPRADESPPCCPELAREQHVLSRPRPRHPDGADEMVRVEDVAAVHGRRDLAAGRTLM